MVLPRRTSPPECTGTLPESVIGKGGLQLTWVVGTLVRGLVILFLLVLMYVMH